jgi:hypothetical protein
LFHPMLGLVEQWFHSRRSVEMHIEYMTYSMLMMSSMDW